MKVGKYWQLAICELPAIVFMLCGAWWWGIWFGIGGATVWSAKYEEE